MPTTGQSGAVHTGHPENSVTNGGAIRPHGSSRAANSAISTRSYTKTLFMLTVFTVFLAGCGGDNAPSDDGAASAGKGSSTASAEAASTEAPKDEVKKKPVAPETAIAKKVALTILGERSSVLAKEGEPLASLLDSIDDATSDVP